METLDQLKARLVEFKSRDPREHGFTAQNWKIIIAALEDEIHQRENSPGAFLS